MDTVVQYGDTSKTLAGQTQGEDDFFTGTDGALNYLYGDAQLLTGRATGGDDTLSSGSNGATNWIYGDAYTMLGLAVGGNDIITGGMNAVNYLYGDAHTMGTRNMGGNDTLSIGTDLDISMINEAFVTAPDTATIAPEQAVALSDNDLFGDAETMSGSTGGTDTLSIGTNWHLTMYTDSASASASAYATNTATATIAPKQTVTIAANSLVGDAETMSGSTGGADTLSIGTNWHLTMQTVAVDSLAIAGTAGTATATVAPALTSTLSDNKLFGDAQTMSGSTGGVDTLSIGSDWHLDMRTGRFRVSAHSFAAIATATVAPELAVALSDNDLFGDAETMSGSTGEADTLSVGTDWHLIMTTDKGIFTATAGTTDSTTATATVAPALTITLSDNKLLGDAQTMSGSTGGTDTLSIGTNWHLTMITSIDGTYTTADSFTTATVTVAPALTITLSDNKLFGDAHTMIDSTGGADTLSIGTGWDIVEDTFSGSILTISIVNNSLVGDAYTMTNSVGGGDTLTGADYAGSVTYLTGDAVYADSTSKGGNDKLISGAGNDHMWGDFGGKDNLHPDAVGLFGEDMFVFLEGNGQDTIYDFHSGEDKIDLSGIAGISGEALALMIADSDDGASRVITLSEGNTITVVGVTELSATDFIFA